MAREKRIPTANLLLESLFPLCQPLHCILTVWRTSLTDSAKALAYVQQTWRQDPPVSPFFCGLIQEIHLVIYLWQVPGVLRTVLKDDVLESGQVNAGSYVFANIAKASQDVSCS